MAQPLWDVPHGLDPAQTRLAVGLRPRVTERVARPEDAAPGCRTGRTSTTARTSTASPGGSRCRNCPSAWSTRRGRPRRARHRRRGRLVDARRPPARARLPRPDRDRPSATALQTVRDRSGRPARVSCSRSPTSSTSTRIVATRLWHDRAVFHFLTEPDERPTTSPRSIAACSPAAGLSWPPSDRTAPPPAAACRSSATPTPSSPPSSPATAGLHRRRGPRHTLGHHPAVHGRTTTASCLSQSGSRVRPSSHHGRNRPPRR